MTEDRFNPVFLTVKEVSELFRIHRSKVYELIHDNTFVGIKIGSDWRIRRDSVEKVTGKIPNIFFHNSGHER